MLAIIRKIKQLRQLRKQGNQIEQLTEDFRGLNEGFKAITRAQITENYNRGLYRSDLTLEQVLNDKED